MLLCILSGCTAKVVYKDASAPVDKRVEDLLGRMTMEEKILQLNQYIVGLNTNVNNIGDEIAVVPAGIGSVIYFSDNVELRNALQKRAVEQTRLGIPVLFGFDVIHGFRTVYPIPLAQGCSWDPELASELCSLAAREARLSGTDWTFSPMVDVSIDPRWGRIAECYGEDPYLNAVMGAAAVRGYQGDDLCCTDHVAACAKHYVGYGRSWAGKDYTMTDISMQSMWDTYLAPYRACVDAGVETVMSAFNDINGVPATANKLMLKEILKGKLGLKGFVVSDWNAVEQLISQGLARDRKEAARLAFEAGVDMDMKDSCYLEHFPVLLKEGLVSEKDIDESVRRILSLKFRLGLFEQPYTADIPESERALGADALAAAAQMAAESMVLLKNDGALPLGDVRRIGVIGPLAKDQDNIIGCWKCHGRSEDVQTLFDGLAEEFGDKAVLAYTRGCDFDGNDRSDFDRAVALARSSDVVVLCLGEKAAWSGENASRSSIALPAVQEELAAAVAAAGKPVVLLLGSGRPVELARLAESADAILEIWEPGVAGGSAAAGILSGRINPSGKLCVTFPLSTGQIPINYNVRRSSRPEQGLYQDIPSAPMYEFGHGLSYSHFEYGDITASSDCISAGETIKLQLPVTNTSGVDGVETVLCFISDPYSSITRPVKELKHFAKAVIKAGETYVYSFEIDPARDLAFVNDKGEPLLENGEYVVHIGDKQFTFELI